MRHLRPIHVVPLLLILLSGIPAHSAAQALQGRVLERQAGDPIANVGLALVGAAGATVATARSGADGSFELRAPAAGEYRVMATRPGYEMLVSGEFEIPAHATIAVEVRMDPAAQTTERPPPEALGRGLHGRAVDDDTGEPIAGARITLRAPRGRTVARVETDDAGRFTIRPPASGGFQVQAERVGYNASAPVQLVLTPGDTTWLEIRLSQHRILLAPVTVVGSSRPLARDADLAGFEWRRRRQVVGRFMGPEEIRRVNPFYASDVLNEIPFVAVAGGARRRVTLRSRLPSLSGSGGCAPNLYVDGIAIRLDQDATFDDFVFGGSIAAIEVYDSPIAAPIEFPARHNPLCGVIVVWTRVGGAAAAQ